MIGNSLCEKMCVIFRARNTESDKSGWALSLLFLALIFHASLACAAEFPPPPAMLANVYHSNVPLADYLVS